MTLLAAFRLLGRDLRLTLKLNLQVSVERALAEGMRAARRQLLNLSLGLVVMVAAMTVGIMPTTGIPLPFVFYGGSPLVATFLAVGLLESVHMRRYL